MLEKYNEFLKNPKGKESHKEIAQKIISLAGARFKLAVTHGKLQTRKWSVKGTDTQLYFSTFYCDGDQ